MDDVRSSPDVGADDALNPFLDFVRDYEAANAARRAPKAETVLDSHQFLVTRFEDDVVRAGGSPRSQEITPTAKWKDGEPKMSAKIIDFEKELAKDRQLLEEVREELKKLVAKGYVTTQIVNGEKFFTVTEKGRLARNWIWQDRHFVRCSKNKNLVVRRNAS
jgi:hypothetical protein